MGTLTLIILLLLLLAKYLASEEHSSQVGPVSGEDGVPALAKLATSLCEGFPGWNTS